MSHYRSNARDLQFNLLEVFDLGSRLGREPYPDLDVETVTDMLEQVDQLATGPIAASYVQSDRTPAEYDPSDCSVALPRAFHDSYRAYREAEWWRLDIPADAGGVPAPRALWWALTEMVLGANPAVYMVGSGPGVGGMLHTLGTSQQRLIGDLMIERGWTASMGITEPDAGSDVGAARTRARLQSDGTWHIEGVKRFISAGEHDLAENIVHLVLARPEGAALGTKGLSLFLVPKYWFDLETGELADRNGVYATGMEDKMGLRVSATCELTFGAQHPARGWLLGEVHDGIAQMFDVIQAARMQVGVKSVAAMSSGYLTALDYARTRVQGGDLAASGGSQSPRVPIIQHPDVRRMLMLQKSYVEGLRAMYVYAADWLDRGQNARQGEAMNELMLPLVKGVSSQRTWEMLTLAVQTLGGSGYLKDYPLEQYLRDTKIDTLYDGTTGMQGMDFFFRKIVRDSGENLETLFAEIDSVTRGLGDEFAAERTAVLTALGHVRDMVGQMLTWQASAVGEIYKIGQHTTNLLLSFGDLMVGYLLTRQAHVASGALLAGAAETDFYRGKLAAAAFFTSTVLPELEARLSVLRATDGALMSVLEEAF